MIIMHHASCITIIIIISLPVSTSPCDTRISVPPKKVVITWSSPFGAKSPEAGTNALCFLPKLLGVREDLLIFLALGGSGDRKLRWDWGIGWKVDQLDEVEELINFNVICKVYVFWGEPYSMKHQNDYEVHLRSHEKYFDSIWRLVTISNTEKIFGFLDVRANLEGTIMVGLLYE